VHGFIKRRSFPLARLRSEAEAANEVSNSAALLSESKLNEKLSEYRSLIRIGKRGEILLQATGFICEAAFRSVGMRPYVEQIMGALLIQGNYAVQMQTGEGKTITAAIAATLDGWKGFPCHVVTSNDYLAGRDDALMRPIYARCGVSSGHVIAGMPPAERKLAYGCDVTYSTSKELLADFLRDKMHAGDALYSKKSELLHKLADPGSLDKRVMRGLYTAIIDEADSVLADEATVPLIISVTGKSRHLKEAVMTALSLAQTLYAGTDYVVKKKPPDIEFTLKGQKKIEDALKKLPSIWSSYERSEYLIRQALIASNLYLKDVHYVVHEGKIVIVDDKTGRMMEGRSWSGGLHQAIEAKEGIELTDVTESHIQMSFQLFFRLYKHLAGMSGTLQNIANELWSIYGLVRVNLPTHVPKQLTAYKERVYESGDRKWDAVIDAVLSEHGKGKAVLVGTRSIKESEALHLKLNDLGVETTVLNALHHEKEAMIIAQAGKKGKVTIATNMAGRGTDILIDRNVAEAGGLHVIATERHESRRVDMQLFGRTARQGLPGSAQMITSLDDEVISRLCPGWLFVLLKKKMNTEWGEKIALTLYVIFQQIAERSRSRLRWKILDQDLKLNKMLSFTRH
jgi:preprotein translocase subunit SecA